MKVYEGKGGDEYCLYILPTSNQKYVCMYHKQLCKCNHYVNVHVKYMYAHTNKNKFIVFKYCHTIDIVV